MLRFFSFLYLIFILFIAIDGLSQTKFVPTVITLYPNESKVDSASYIELKLYEKTGVVTDQLRKEFLREGLASNWKIIRENELSFMDQQDFWSLLILSVTRELTYKEIENRSNLLIYPLKQTLANTLPSYKKLADQNKVSWVVNFVRAEALQEADKQILRVTVQLYNVVTNRIFLDKVYSVDSFSLTQSENCEDKWLCMAEHIQQAVVFDLADKIEKYIRHERL